MQKLGKGGVALAPQVRQLISSRQVASALVLPVRSVYQLARQGRIPGVIRLGRRVRFDAAVVERWLRIRRKAELKRREAR